VSEPRILPEKLEEHYVTTGLLPTKCMIYGVRDGVEVGCGLGATVFGMGLADRLDIDVESNESVEPLYDRLRGYFGTDYVDGYMSGFDTWRGHLINREDVSVDDALKRFITSRRDMGVKTLPPRYIEGYKDGFNGGNRVYGMTHPEVPDYAPVEDTVTA
jgi:hypothetical protein